MVEAVGAPAVRAIAPAVRPLEEPLRRGLADSDRKWRAAEAESIGAAAAFMRELEPQIVRAVLQPLDLTTLVGESVDLDELAERIDVDRVAERLDLDSLILRLDAGEVNRESGLDPYDAPVFECLPSRSTGSELPSIWT
jgi:hypothetical protein